MSAGAVEEDAGGAGARALVVAVRNGRSNASLSLETFLGPKPGRRASCAVSARAIFAKLCVPPQHQSSSFMQFDLWGGGEGRTPKDARRVSASVLFTRWTLVSAVRRSALGVLSMRSRMRVGGRCSDCL